MPGALVSNFDPELYQLTRNGDVFTYYIASQALILSATTGGHPTIINPIGSGKNLVPLALRIGFTSGTTVIGSVLIAETLNVGGGAATAAPIATATLVPTGVRNAYRQGDKAKTSVMQWSPTTNTFTAAPAILCPALNLGAAAPTGTGTYEAFFNGSLIFAPGTAMSVTYSVTTSTALFHVTIIAAEVPIN